MSSRQTVILDGSRSEDVMSDSILTLLSEVLRQYGADKIETFKLRHIRINPCLGCFNCWLKTPGQCVHHGDKGGEILQAILKSNKVILYTPIVFGGYSSELKKMVDRLLPMVLPFFKKAHGETHHPPRYPTFPHIIGIGVHPAPDKKIAECFKTLVGRNALNLPPSHYSTEVINSTEDSPQELRNRFRAVLSRTDPPPLYNKLQSLLQDVTPTITTPVRSRRILIITGSQKKNQISTSSVLGEYLIKRFKKQNIENECLALQKSLLNDEKQHLLCSAVDRADTVLLTSPLYFDSLPFLVTKAFETIALHRKNTTKRTVKRFVAVLNNGLPESYQNTVAFSICRNFASESGMRWAGGLAMGTGEGLINGKSPAGFHGFGSYKRPPLLYILKALKMTASALAEGYPVPEQAAQLIAKKPVPFISWDSWRTYVIKTSKRLLEEEAVKNGLRVEDIYKQPYANK